MAKRISPRSMENLLKGRGGSSKLFQKNVNTQLATLEKEEKERALEKLCDNMEVYARKLEKRLPGKQVEHFKRIANNFDEKTRLEKLCILVEGYVFEVLHRANPRDPQSATNSLIAEYRKLLMEWVNFGKERTPQTNIFLTIQNLTSERPVGRASIALDKEPASLLRGNSVKPGSKALNS